MTNVLNILYHEMIKNSNIEIIWQVLCATSTHACVLQNVINKQLDLEGHYRCGKFYEVKYIATTNYKDNSVF